MIGNVSLIDVVIIADSVRSIIIEFLFGYLACSFRRCEHFELGCATVTRGCIETFVSTRSAMNQIFMRQTFLLANVPKNYLATGLRRFAIPFLYQHWYQPVSFDLRCVSSMFCFATSFEHTFLSLLSTVASLSSN